MLKAWHHLTMTDHEIARACDIFGAQAVSDAALRRMAGDQLALRAVGLPDAANIGIADRVAQVAFKLMDPAERAGDLAAAAIALARI